MKMKTNKIIILSYFSFIVVFLLSLMIMGFAFRNKKYEDSNIEKETKEIDLDNFSHMNISQEGCDVILGSNEKNELTYIHNLKDSIIAPKYEIRNDTLFILSTKNNLNDEIRVKVKDIKSIICCKSELSIREFIQDSVKIEANLSKVYIKKDSEISFVDIELKNSSNLYGSNYNGSSFKLNIDNSKFEISADKKLDLVEGIVAKSSSVRLPKVLKIDIDSDETSEVKMY